jgi:hypothetical protein
MNVEQIVTEPREQAVPRVEMEEFKFEMTDFGPSYTTADPLTGFCSCICHSCICSCATAVDQS